MEIKRMKAELSDGLCHIYAIFYRARQTLVINKKAENNKIIYWHVQLQNIGECDII